jgi:hypothetical protein
MQASKYPFGVILIAIAQFAAAAVVVVAAFIGGFVGDFLIGLTGGGHYHGSSQNSEASYNLSALLASPIWGGFIGSGLGLLLLRRWAWFLTFALCILWLIPALILLVIWLPVAPFLPSGFLSPRIVFLGLLNTAIPAATIWYLRGPEVRKIYGS